MLVANGSTRLADARLEWGFALSRRIWCLAVDRRGLALDTRFVPAASGPAKQGYCLYLLVSGTWMQHPVAPGEPPGPTFVGPAAFILSNEQLEGANGRRSSTFRSWGEPYIAIELHATRDDLRVSSTFPNEVSIDEESWAAAADFARMTGEPDATVSARASTLLSRLEAAGIFVPGFAASAQKSATGAIERVWRALRPMVQAMAPASSLEDLSNASGISTRQVARDIEKLFSLGFYGVRWRPATLHARIKIAVLLLSAERSSVTDVAHLVGYGSVNAMNRAFRDAGLDAPSDVQERLRAPV